MNHQSSPFLYPGDRAKADRLAILHLKRDSQVPTILKERDEDDEGYFEGKVVNTRFGSFPHSTLIGVPWGTQVLASKVDTGSRGRRGDKKRKRVDSEEGQQVAKRGALENGEEDGDVSTPVATTETREAVAAASGFIHLLPPTPENWTSSLPHRTQVVYTPDYSYILHRLRARPGTNIIEAGAGSGSFTHASARAVFSGYPGQQFGDSPSKKRKLGKVWSYEFHEQRHGKLVQELQDHALEGIVEITHRDVCEEGFLLEKKQGTTSDVEVKEENIVEAIAKDEKIAERANENGIESPTKEEPHSDKISPMAEAIFLDLPAPWLALPHLVRSKPATYPADKAFLSPLNPTSSVQLCTFSPCIEQVQRTVSTMRHLGWVDIEMVELSQKRLEIRRERIGVDAGGAQRGAQLTPATVAEAVARLKEVEGNFKTFHETGEKVKTVKSNINPNTRGALMESLVQKKIYKEGRLVHRTEPEVKTHTSYLVFAVLPREWSEEDEANAASLWPVTERKGATPEQAPKSKKQLKREARAAYKDAAEARKIAAANGEVVEDAAAVSAVSVPNGDDSAELLVADHDPTDAMDVDTTL